MQGVTFETALVDLYLNILRNSLPLNSKHHRLGISDSLLNERSVICHYSA